MDRLRFGHERPTDQDCCLICTCLSVRNFENAINKSYTHVQPHCIFFFQCRTGVIADCFKFCGTRHARHTQLMYPRLCTTKHFTTTQLKLFTLVGVANLLLEVSPRRGPIMTLSETPSKEQHENGTTYQTPQLGPAPKRSSGLTSNNRLATPTSVNSFNCVIVKCLVVHSLDAESYTS
jgi:hypothetical protein